MPTGVSGTNRVAVHHPALGSKAAASSPRQSAKTAGASDVLVRESADARAARVRRYLFEDNRAVIAANPAGAQAKLDKIATCPFAFFRGTAALFYRDLRGLDATMTKVLVNGDVHPENFGVIQGANGKLFFGLNDFDETATAPFAWDLRRGVTAFELAARQNELAAGARHDVGAAFLAGYRDGVDGFKRSQRDERSRVDHDRAPKAVRHLLETSVGMDREAFLEDKVDPKTRRFIPSASIRPVSKRVAEFQAAIDGYKTTIADARYAKGSWKVLDVAIKPDSGTASLGTERYYVLIEGARPAEKGLLVLEVKQERRAILEGYFGKTDLAPAARVAENQSIGSPSGDPFCGFTELKGKSFLVRERSPHKLAVDLATLSADELVDYAKVCGEILARAHLRSSVKGKHSARDEIREALDDRFVDALLEFGDREATRVTADHTAYAAQWAKGKFKVGRQADPD
jgi:uncharacterized protein (DUF2252 family)